MKKNESKNNNQTTTEMINNNTNQSNVNVDETNNQSTANASDIETANETFDNSEEKLDDFDGDILEGLYNIVPPEKPKKKRYNLISALCEIVKKAHDSELSDSFWDDVKEPLAFVRRKTGLKDIQILVVAMLLDSDDTLSLANMASYLDCNRIEMMAYKQYIDDLVKMRWANRRSTRRDRYGYCLAEGVAQAILENRAFEPENLSNLSLQEIIDRLEAHVGDRPDEDEIDDNIRWFIQVCEANRNLPLCNTLLSYDGDIFTQQLLMLCLHDYAQYGGLEEEGLTLDTIDDVFPTDFHCGGIRKKCRSGNQKLFKDKIVEHRCDQGLSDPEQIRLTTQFKETNLLGYTPSQSKKQSGPNLNRELKNYHDIPAKTMYYNKAEEDIIGRIADLLSQDKMAEVQKRLEESGLRKGVACLFYGLPGTGKTETVYQLARQTGRHIMQVDLSTIKDKWVGESEKRTRAIFKKYRTLCKQSEVAPILLLNEADGLLCKRIENINHSVDQMLNTMQNIILQEMETLDGILIATTNLSANLDDAFERRFLFKVEFQKPDKEAKAKLWLSMMGDTLNADEAARLAENYDFSGGQIENIMRKCTINYIISGCKDTFDVVEKYCKEELLNKTSGYHRITGFGN